MREHTPSHGDSPIHVKHGYLHTTKAVVQHGCVKGEKNRHLRPTTQSVEENRGIPYVVIYGRVIQPSGEATSTAFSFGCSWYPRYSLGQKNALRGEYGDNYVRESGNLSGIWRKILPENFSKYIIQFDYQVGSSIRNKLPISDCGCESACF